MTIWTVSRAVLVALSMLPGFAVETQDPAVLAAQRALDAGQPVAALQVLDGHAARRIPGEVCLLRARAALALGRPAEAIDGLGIATIEDLAHWPERLRGATAAVMGECVLAENQVAAARPWLEQALRLRGGGVEVDRTLVLLAEACERLGDGQTAARAVHLVWRDWPRSVYRARAGLMAARLAAGSNPDEARELLAGVRALDHIDPATRLAATELLCHLLLPAKPGQCLVVAEQEIAHGTSAGRLPLYRALALGALDPQEGGAALDALPSLLRDDPAAVSARTRWVSATGTVQDVALRLERARVELDLGRSASARTMLEPLAASQPAALILLTQVPDLALDPWLAAPAMADPAARAAVAIALARRGDFPRSWTQFTVVLRQELPASVTPASVWFWAARSAQVMAPERAQELTARLLAASGEGIELGITWVEEAQRREATGGSAADITVAWERAGLALPPSHSWQPGAVLRAVRPLVQAGEWSRARILLERISPTGTTEDHLRCRFLLVQVYEHLELIAPALDLVRDLLPAASPEQTEKLERIRARLSARATSEVPPRPLDAEN